jgi:hypothetical protein
MTKTDLIALDSPFLAEPPEPAAETAAVDFQSIWDALKGATASRGWCEVDPEELRQRFQALPHRVTTTPSEVEPYQGANSGKFIYLCVL